MIDASALVDLLLGEELGRAVARRLEGRVLHAPAHVDAEVLSALGRLYRAGTIAADDTTRRIDALVSAPIERHPVPQLMVGAWHRREHVRLVDGLYVELAARLHVPLVTTDGAFGRATDVAEVVTG